MNMRGTFALLLMFPLAAPLADTQVPVMTRTLKAGEAITADTVMVRNVSDSKVFAGTVKDSGELSNMQAAHTLKVGQPITRLQIKPMHLVERDSAVTLRWSKGGVVLEGAGRTLDAGNEGETVRVMSSGNRSVVQAVVVGKGLVTVQ